MDLQYDMFIDRNAMTSEEAHVLRQEIKYVIDSANRVRRGLFSRLNDQNKMILKLMQDIEDLKGKRKPEIYEFKEEHTLFKRKHG